MSQKEQILKDLLDGRYITPLDALRRYGCFRLGARIRDLRNEGYDICTEMITDLDTDKRYAEYFIMPQKREAERERYENKTKRARYTKGDCAILAS